MKDTEKATGIPISANLYKRPKEAPSADLAPYFAWRNGIACVVDEPVGEAMFGPALGKRAGELLEKLGYIDIQNLAKWMKAELLMFTGLLDASCPPITQFAMYNKVSSPKKVIFYPEYGHEGMKGAEDILFAFLSDL